MSKKAQELIARALKNSKLKNTDVFTNTKIFKDQFSTRTPVPMLNVALSSYVDNGLTAGVTVLAGASKSFKTMFGLLKAAAYMKQFPDAIMLFYDNEFGSPPSYLKTYGIDTDRVIHIPVHTIEEIKFDMVSQLEGYTRKDNVFVFVDSVGNIASKKELEDAITEKSVVDMTRAKALKALFRIVTPYFTTLDIPGVFINHVYKSQGMFASTVVSGGTGIYYSADTIFVITKAKDRNSKKELTGFTFYINIEKSRFVQEGMKIPIRVDFKKGIIPFSGLLEEALQYGMVTKAKKGFYTRILPDPETGEVKEDKNWRAAATDCKEFWNPIFKETDLGDLIHNKYAIANLDEMVDMDFDILDVS